MSDSDTPGFSLIDQPWLLVRRTDGTLDELSLLQVFQQAHQLAALAGELPTQVFALTRLLLAVLHQAVDGPRDDDHWEQLWKAEVLPVSEIEDYLERYRSRFDLFDPVAPFFQVAGLRTKTDSYVSPQKLIADVPDNKLHFTTRLGRSNTALSFSEAARWLVHCQSYDTAGTKSGVLNDPRGTSGRSYPTGYTAWAGQIGGVLPEGANLKQSLMLNLIARDFGPLDRWAATDAPVWELPPIGASEEVEGGRDVLGPVDLYTWQGRRLRLRPKNGRVDGVVLTYGEKIVPQNRHLVEPHAAWKVSKKQSANNGGRTTYMPVVHRVNRSVWRGLESLLPKTSSRQTAVGQQILSPLCLEWIAHLCINDYIFYDFRFAVRAVGVEYGPNSSSFAEIVDDVMTLGALVLNQDGRQALGSVATRAVDAAKECAVALGRLAGNLVEAGGGDFSGPRDRAEELAYAELDTPFRTWLADLTGQSHPLEAEQQWHLQADRIVGRLAYGLVEQASPAAWSGRLLRGNLVTTAHAEMWFRRNLAKAVPLAHVPVPTEQEVTA